MEKNFDSSAILKGVGIDLTLISRYSDMDEERQARFAKFVLSQDELDTYNSAKTKEQKDQRLAVFFCAKEAVSKALGTGFAGVSPRSIIIRSDEKGRPYVSLKDNALKAADELGITGIKVSVSHEGGYVTVMAVAV